MNTKVEVDEALTRKIAALGRVSLTPDEVARFTTQLQSIMEYFRELDKVDVSGVEPVWSPVDLASALREDVVKPFEEAPKEGQLKITSSASEVLYDGYKVPPVL